MNDNNYNPNEIESKWYKKWECSGVFDSIPNKQKAFTITMPPPNVTGVLHMGHILNNTIQDAFIRYARMKNYNACWLPGMDHASIATENKVVSALQKKGIEKNDLSRTEFLKYVWDWKEKHGGIILKQLRYLGASCDWKRTKFTMDNDMSESVIDIFIDLYKKGVIYRGVRMVNWDSKAQTALSDEEVIYKETESTLYYIRYLIEGSNQFLEIATSRPETLLGDSAVCVNPNDQRYIHLRNKYVITPIIGRKIPIIFDDYVDSEFGSGVLKITPAHDINDYCIGLKYNLDIINILNNDGTVNELGGKFQGQDRFECRANILKELRELGLLVKEVPYINNIGYSERTNSIIEPKLSTQWFCKMNELAKPAINVVTNNQIKFYPDKYKNIYLHWMNNIKDWCISRQLWWGQRIPAYYIDNGEYVVAKDIEEAYIIFKQKYPDLSITDLKQDEDVLDTWFSSALWPFSTLGWPEDTEDLKRYFPTDVLVTAYDIIFFWVARMAFSSLKQMKTRPFKDCIIHGLIRDKEGRKMSKSLGNGIDPMDLIKNYGTDALRFYLTTASSMGTDIRFDTEKVSSNWNFINKLWNASRFVLMNIEGFEKKDYNLDNLTIPDKWILTKLNNTIKEVRKNFDKYEFNNAGSALYSFIWDDFCDWYIELSKFNMNNTTKSVLLTVLTDILKMLHPMMPYVTEEIYSMLPVKEAESIMISKFPKYNKKYIFDAERIRLEKIMKDIVAIRNMKATNGITKDAFVKIEVEDDIKSIYTSQLKIKDESLTAENKDMLASNYKSSLIDITYYYEGSKEDSMKTIEEIKKLEESIARRKKLLSNENYVNKAPKNIVDMDREKLKEEEERLAILKSK